MSGKHTKNELRNQQVRLAQFERYLPTLQLKKAMLQFEINLAMSEWNDLKEKEERDRMKAKSWSSVLKEKVAYDLPLYAKVLHVKKRYENVAGVEVPLFEEIVFQADDYFLFDTPPWMEQALSSMRCFVETQEQRKIVEEKTRALKQELREVSIRVNLFEKVLIPRTLQRIKKTKIFLGDLELAAVAQAKIAKKKISQRKG